MRARRSAPCAARAGPAPPANSTPWRSRPMAAGSPPAGGRTPKRRCRLRRHPPLRFRQGRVRGAAEGPHVGGDASRLLAGWQQADLWQRPISPPSSGMSGAQADPSAEGTQAHIYAAAFTPDGERAVTGSDDTTLRLWRVSDGSLIKEMKGTHQGIDRALPCRPTDGIIASGRCRQARSASGTAARALPAHVRQPGRPRRPAQVFTRRQTCCPPAAIVAAIAPSSCGTRTPPSSSSPTPSTTISCWPRL